MTTRDTEALRAHARNWLAVDPDVETRASVRALLDAGDDASLREHFGTRLQFGTAGMRGVRGAGPARMNRLLARLTAGALAQVLIERVPDAAARGVVIGFDARHLSRELAHDTAGVLVAAGIRVHFIGAPSPTPLVPFAVLDRGAAAGIVLTASHNPPEYNGFKVYWDDGAPILPPVDGDISAALDALDLAHPPPCPEPDAVRSHRLLDELGEELEGQYLDAVIDATDIGDSPALPIVYTPLHGVAGSLALRALARRGFHRVGVVDAQFRPDGDFPTLDFPNPEEAGTLALALEQARAERAALVLANDPDGDRLAVIARHGDDYVTLSGDQIGWLLGDFLLERHPPEANAKTFVITTLVSSVLLQRIAESHGASSERTLTGLKWVWRRALELEAAGGHFLFGYEESIGYSVCPRVRDKDGISAAALFADLARHCAARDRTVIDRLDDIHRRAGFADTRTLNLRFTDAAHRERIAERFDRLREAPPAAVGPFRLEALCDYRRRTRIDAITATRTALTLPGSDLVQLELAGGSRISLRPSGTEPKFKIYIECYVPPDEIVDLETTRTAASETIDRLEAVVRDWF